jgi:hypothetical protein
MRKTCIAILLFLMIGCSEQDNSHQNQGVTVTIERSRHDSFEFTIMPPTGSGEITVKGNTAKLLTNIPYLFTSGIFPPEKVLNEILSKGISDAGMSGGARWKPYKIKIGDFESIFKEVKSISNSTNLEYLEPDDWVKSFEDWNVWVMYIKHGIPWEEHKRLNDSLVAIEKELEIAKVNNNTARINELHLKNVEAGTRLSEYVMRHINK